MNIEVKASNTPLILTTGMYDLLKEELRKRKLSKYNEEKLKLELKFARQLLKRDIPENIVAVNRAVRIKDIETGEEFTYKLVAPDKAKRKNQTHSILSAIGVAMLGYSEGSDVVWEMAEGIRAFRIEEVKNIE